MEIFRGRQKLTPEEKKRKAEEKKRKAEEKKWKDAISVFQYPSDLPIPLSEADLPQINWDDELGVPDIIADIFGREAVKKAIEDTEDNIY